MSAPTETTNARSGTGASPATGGSMQLGSVAAVNLIARREISTKLRDKGFLISTVVIALVILGSFIVPAVFGGDGDRYPVGVVNESDGFGDVVTAQADAAGVSVDLTSYDDLDAARAALDDEEVDAVVDGDQVLVRSTLDDGLKVVLDAANAAVVGQERLAESGIDPGEVAQALDVPPLSVVSLDPDAERNQQRQLLAVLGVALLYGLLVLIGQYVAMGVVEEKSSRVVELLLSAVKPWQLLTGKVVGLGVLGLIQLAVIGAVGLGAALGLDLLAVPGDAIGTLLQVLGWFILGYAFYAALFACGAALVSRQEDLQSVLLPMVMGLVAAFVIALQAAGNPEGTLALVCSYIPGLSPLVMPVRMAGGTVAWWEVVAAVLLMVLAVAVILRVGGRIYAGALLRTGGRVKIKDALAGAADR